MRKRLTYSCEAERVNFDTLCCDVFFLEFARKMTLDESGLVYYVSFSRTKQSRSEGKIRSDTVLEQGDCVGTYFACATITDKNELECRRALRSFGHCEGCVLKIV